jgi:aspartyl protease family protein
VSPGSSATLVIDGGSPVTIDVGHTVSGVTLHSADRNGAEVSVGGRRRSLPLVPYRGSVSRGTAASVTLTANGAGHFFTQGYVNGSPVPFILDTGATWITMSRGQADQIGLDYESGRGAYAQTASGMVAGWRFSVDSVRVGDLELYDVGAMVIDAEAPPVALLGMSFLNQLDMERSGSSLVLRRR